ncbi:hypothetical protein BS50DRAFT_236049 [Corynespora cassiicola Philippines]|uniref:Transcription elongation factor Eaf N-terminal domain-containing protein n=1 Tax=Corynespora cassiicola Philippines TaxID=1448308 RepID=A0A2T2P2F1_CORCC|nr:hypothetical protein BS50DRAFT_236049 [Corynespora cassiicola Philippines]
MASPMIESRVDPHKKAHFSLHISDRIAKGDGDAGGAYSSVKYNHKPPQTTSSRTTTITSASGNNYNLRLEDLEDDVKKDVFVFTGQRTAPQPSYVLLLDPSTQRATLEPLTNTYTFNLASKNGDKSISSAYTKVYPKRSKRDSDSAAAADTNDLFDEEGADSEHADPDPNNPYDFRHFLNLNERKDKGGDESDYKASSPDYRTGTGSAMNTPQVSAVRKPAPTSASKPKASQQAPPKVKRKKSPGVDPLMSKKPGAKKQSAAQATPTVRLDRRATDQAKTLTATSSTPAASKPRKTASKAAPPASKIKSAEIVHSSDDESDVDADGEPDSQPVSSPVRRSPSPPRYIHPTHDDSDFESDEDEDEGAGGGRGGGGIGLEIEVPDETPSASSKPRALASLGLGQNIGRGYLKSPSNGPISLASAANSVEGSPDPRQFGSRGVDDGAVIDFGSLGGGNRDDDDPLLKEMMEGLAGDSSEESEEE